MQPLPPLSMLSGLSVRGSDVDGGIQVARAHHGSSTSTTHCADLSRNANVPRGFPYQPRSGDEELERKAGTITHERAVVVIRWTESGAHVRATLFSPPSGPTTFDSAFYRPRRLPPQ